uniref:Mediator of DNA damage checkpoint protein 1 n=1 Tax=Trichogramma kaykai TaxID=54128 RepID=A0ABD2WMN9_9HYME
MKYDMFFCSFKNALKTVSKFHAEIEAQSYHGTIFIRDLKSSNKTRINNSKLRPECNYQLKNGDEVRFGTVLAKLHIIGSIDDSFVSSTPLNIKRKHIVIPGTPDTSMNENSFNLDDTDDSVIQATQPDKLTSRDGSNKYTVNLGQDSTSYNVSYKENLNNSIYSAETQKSKDVGNHNESDENIFEVETQQVHSDIMHKQEKQQIDNRKLNISKNVSNDVSIYSADTQKILNKSNDSSHLHESKTFDASIHSAETQKYKIDESEVKKRCFTDDLADVLNESINEAETQQFNKELCQVNDEQSNSKSEKFDDFFYEAATQKFEQQKMCRLDNSQNTSNSNKNNFLKQIEDPFDEIETQKFHDKSSPQNKDKPYQFKTPKSLIEQKRNSNLNQSTKSIHDVETQEFHKNILPRKLLDEEETQSFIKEDLSKHQNSPMSSSLEEAETQKLVLAKPSEFLTPKSLSKSMNKSSSNQTPESISDMETQEFCEKNVPRKLLDEEDTEPYTEDFINQQNSPSINKSLNEAETQRFELDEQCLFKTPKSHSKSMNKSSSNQTPESISDMESQEFCEKNLPRKLLDEEDTEPFTEDLIKQRNSPSIHNSLDEAETQRFELDKQCLFKTPKSHSTSMKKSSLNKATQSIHDIETQEFCKNKLPRKLSDEEETQRFIKEDLSKCQNSPSFKNSLDGAETQKFELDKQGLLKTPKSHSKSMNKSNLNQSTKSIHDMETQEFHKNILPRKLLDEEETQSFIKEDLSKHQNSPSMSSSLEEAETQKFVLAKPSEFLTPKSLSKSMNKSSSNQTPESISDMETLFNASVKVTNQNNSIGEKETQQFSKEELSKFQSLSEVKNSLQEAETQKFGRVYSKSMNRSSTNQIDINQDGEFFNTSLKRNSSGKKVFPSNYEISSKLLKLEGNNTSKTMNDSISLKQIDGNSNNSSKEIDSSSKLVPSPTEDMRKQFNSSKNISFGNRLKNDSSIFNKKDLVQVDDNELDLFSQNDEDIFAPYETETKESKTFKSSKTSSTILNTNKTSLGKSFSFIYQRSPSPESDDNIFDDDYEEKMKSKCSLVNIPNASFIKAESLVKSSVTIKNAQLSNTLDDDVDEIGPTQPVNTSTFDTEDIHLAVTQIATPQGTKKNVPGSIVNQDDDSLAPTQLIFSECCDLPQEKDFDEIDLPCTLKISTQQLDEDLAHTPNTKRCSHPDESTNINNLGRDMSIAETKNEMKNASNINRSKRFSNELEVSPRKRFRRSSYDSDTKEKMFQNMEENLEKIFEGDTEEELTVAKSTLQTQQLKNILEASQLEDSCQENSSNTKSSPTLGKISGSKIVKDFHQPTSHSSSKSKTFKTNLNDTIERNLCEMFENNSNDVSSHQPEILMTQQLTDVLESQLEQSAEEKKSDLATTDEKSKKSSESESSKTENQICYRRGTIGFDLDLNCVKSKERVAVCPLITSDSQSDNEATTNIEVNSTPSRKRLSLSLPKNINLNASLRSEPGTSKSSYSPKIRNSASKKRHVLSRGTRGFNLDLQAIESETLVSADSTENEDDKVGSYRLKSNLMGGSQLKSKIASESSDSDDVLDNLPEVKIAGTKECPATASQLAVPSDDDDDDVESIEPTKIPLKWRWYAEKRYDLIYENLERPVDTKPESRPPSEPKPLSVDDILASLGPPVTDETKSRQTRRTSNCTLTAQNESPQTLVTNNSDATFQQVDTDSDSSSEEMFPEYKPLPPAKFLGRRATFNQLESKLDDKNLDDSDDEEFNLLRQRCHELLKQPQILGTKKLSSTLQTAKNSSSLPTRSSRRRRKCASDNYQLNSNSTELDNTDDNDEIDDNIVGDGQGKQVQSENTIASKDTFVFQVPNVSLVPVNHPEMKLATVPTTTRTTNDERQGTKRGTRHEKDSKVIPKLPKVSVLISPLREKFLTNKINRQLLLSANTVSMFKQKDAVPKNDQKFAPTIRVTRRDFIPDPPSFVEKSSKTKGKPNESLKENFKLDSNVENNSRAPKNSKSNQLKRNQKNFPEVGKSISNALIDDSDSSDEFEELRLAKMNSLKQENSFNKSQELVNDPKNADRSIIRGKTSSNSVIKSDDSKEIKVLLNKVDNLEKTELKNKKNHVGITKIELENSKIIGNNTSSRNDKRKKVSNYSAGTQDTSNQGIKNKNYNTRNTKMASDSNSITSPIAIRKSKRIKNNLKSQNSEIDEKEFDSMSSTTTISTSPDRSLKTKISTSKTIGGKRKKSLDESIQGAHALAKQTRKKVNKDENNSPLIDSVRSTRSKRKMFNLSPPVSPKRNKLLKNQQSILTDSTTAVKVLFIGEISVHHRKIVSQLGGMEVDDISKCSVVVCEKVQKDFKFLSSLSRGISIVSLKWLDASNKAKQFLNYYDYILKDKDAESNYRFNLNDSIERARNVKLLQDYTVLIAPRLKTISVPELKELIITNGGKALVRAPKNWDRKLVIIGEESDLDGMLKFMEKAPNTVTVHSIEFILTGILRQKLSLTEFKLSL